ncbi:hypothetical protein BDQ12DRAFT_688615 [Crucibulum laeve]|uniref:F-box domain-containing protein n=1 Tax=Crucibulum laeve TaxID=68775 RepID=A0A5C3LQM8_9AGAR|nr:hypothetical protein BDQ12DRAFT_688615 [Crucibulum laeve]
MARHLNPEIIPPDDILRLILEYAAELDRRTALNLVLVSRLSQKWIDPILYSVVTLHRRSTSRAFLRTIETSISKPPIFFRKRVKSLCICHDIYDETAIKILSACRGINSLTFWAIPRSRRQPFMYSNPTAGGHTISYRHHPYPISSNDRVHHTQGPRLFSAYRFPTLPMTSSKLASVLENLRPRHLSALLRDGQGFSCDPQFHLPFFSRITHFSIINKWEDWTAWNGFENLYSLTHISLDLSAYCTDRISKARKVAASLSRILACCQHLEVCLVVLLFHPDAVKTVNEILSFMLYNSGQEGGGVYDHRLVFAMEKEPFRGRDAHSYRQMEVWRRADHIAEMQRRSLGHIVPEL